MKSYGYGKSKKEKNINKVKRRLLDDVLYFENPLEQAMTIQDSTQKNQNVYIEHLTFKPIAAAALVSTGYP